MKVPDAAFDAVVCQQGLQFFPDRVEALKEMARATRPQGRIAVAVWGTIDKCTVWDAIHKALLASVSADIADMMQAPFSLNDPEELRTLCEAAGLKNIDIQGHTRSMTFEGGVGQVIRCLEATPISAKLPEEKRDIFSQELEAWLEPLLDREIVQSPTFSHITLAQP